MTDRKRYLNTSLAKALRVLELFEPGREEMTLSDLARGMNTRPGSIYPIVHTLEQFGCLERDPDTKRFRLGLKVLALANQLLSSVDVREQAKPILRQLAAERRVNAHLAVLYEDEALYLDRETAAPSFVLPAVIGRRVPLYCTALGKILLAYNPDVAARVLSIEAFPAMTQRTITSPAKLRRQLLQIVERGYAVEHEEFHDGNVCTAAPIRNYRGTVIAAVSLSIASTRLKQEPLSAFTAAVVDGAKAISQGMGFSDS